MVNPADKEKSQGPLEDLDQWDDDVRRRYPQPEPDNAVGLARNIDLNKKKTEFRNYRAEVRPCVREFYRLNHIHQTVDFVKSNREQYLPLKKTQMGIWQAIELLNTLVDDSDPDIDLPQIEHLLQTAEDIRRDGHPRWFILTGLIHDLGKILCFWDESQWAVVGDTYPVGCQFSDEIVFSEFFKDNPDSQVPEYSTPCGIYEEGCGLENVLMSWGHDEYLYYVVKDYLPEEARYIVRYHSFYPAHRHGQYDQLMNDRDREMFRWVKKFNPYDLYTKSHQRPNVEQLRPFYQELIDEYFPETIHW